jgi:hypothetical protein
MAKGKKTGGAKPLVDGDERDAAAQADDIMQRAGQMMRGSSRELSNSRRRSSM